MEQHTIRTSVEAIKYLLRVGFETHTERASRRIMSMAAAA